MKNKVRRFLAGSVLIGTVLTAGTTFASITDINRRIKAHTPSIFGTVSTVNGNTLIINSKMKHRGGTTYTVDASNAKIIKEGTSTAISNITVGDRVKIKGSINGTNIKATSIRDNSLLMGNNRKKAKNKIII